MTLPRKLALAGLAGFLALVALQHLLRPDLAPAEHFVSEYARGWTEPLQILAFVAWAVAIAASAALALLARHHGRPLARGLTAAALVVGGAGTLMAAAFTSQTVAGELPPGTERTLEGRLHDLGTLLLLAGLLLAALASLRLVRERGYRLTVAALGIALLAIVPALMALEWDAPGIGQRGFILVGCAWQWRFVRAVA